MSPRLLRPRASGASAIFATDADARAYISAVTAADGQPLEQATQLAIDAFVIGCKTDGIWLSLKTSCILMGARTLSGALTPLVGPATTNNNFVSGDYNRKTGLLGDGSTKRISTNLNHNTIAQDNYHSAVYASTHPTQATSSYIGAGYNITGRSTIIRSSGTISGPVQSSSTNPNLGSFDAFNLPLPFLGNARNSSTDVVGRYNNTTTVHTGANASTSQTPANDMISVFARTTTSNSPAYGNPRLAFFSAGNFLDLALLDARVSALYTAIGAAIP